MEKPDIQSSSVESKEFFAGIKVILKENVLLSRNLSIVTAVSPLSRRHSVCINCELIAYVVGCSEPKFVKKQKNQSCLYARQGAGRLNWQLPHAVKALISSRNQI